MTRLDQHLVETGLASSRARAKALIEAGAVTVDGTVARKPSQAVATGVEVAVTADPCPWVSRAALKLLHALDEFGLNPRGVALDVGHGQLHPRIAADPRVVGLEGVNARDIPAGLVPPVDWIVADVSFISLEKALPGPLALARPGAVLVALIKPQFEAGRAHVGRGGIVRDGGVHAAVRARIRDWLEHLGWQVTGEAPSPIEGGDGNREFLIAALKVVR